jgi:hypothetical protein
MSRNGTGTYTLPAGNPVVTGTTISSTWANNTLTDIATALTGSLAADGQTTATGNLKLGNNRITGLADGIASTDAASLAQVTSAVAITGGTINGTSVGATTASTGAFTNFTASGTASFTSTGAVKVPVGTTVQQPSPVTGMIRYNSTTNLYEGYGASSWSALGGGAAGSNTQVQYNNSGAFAGSANLTFDGTTLEATALKTATLNAPTGPLVTQNGMTGIAKAWVQFNGSTGAIAGSFNVSSVTVNSTGYYTINFTTAMSNANYSVIGSLSATSGTGQNNVFQPFTVVSTGGTTAPTTSSFVCSSINGGGTSPVYVCISVFGS